jgi:hypothetical protein
VAALLKAKVAADNVARKAPSTWRSPPDFRFACAG